VRALETHPKAILTWKIKVEFSKVTGFQFSVKAYTSELSTGC
jgi:hypothetical protein